MNKPDKIEIGQLWQFECVYYKYLAKVIEVGKIVTLNDQARLKIIKCYFNNSSHPRNLDDHVDPYISDLLKSSSFTYFGMEKIPCEKCKK